MNSRRRKPGVKPGVKMETVLTPEQCKKMKHFLTLLKFFYLHAKKEGIEKPDIIAFMNAYSDLYGRLDVEEIESGLGAEAK